jgi:hypothetical protein
VLASDNGEYGTLGTTPGRQEGHAPRAVPLGLPHEVLDSREQVACPYRLLQGTVGTSGLSEREEIHLQGLSPARFGDNFRRRIHRPELLNGLHALLLWQQANPSRPLRASCTVYPALSRIARNVSLRSS